jgi:uncharacterized protein (TIGR02452 family)
VREVLEALSVGSYVAADGRRVDISAPVASSIEGTTCATSRSSEIQTPKLLGDRPRPRVRSTTTVECARELAAWRDDVALLSFASGKQRGGWWHVGARAQEEDLIRCSTLLESLDRAVAADEFYEANAEAGPSGADACLRSPQVLLIRGADGQLLGQPAQVAVLTSAAPEAFRFPSTDHPELLAVVRRRWDLILSTAQSAGDRALVLGAWGCGEYSNDPGAVARILREALEDLPAGAFDVIELAIQDDDPGRTTELAFRQVFADGED